MAPSRAALSSSASMPWSTFAAALTLAGAEKSCDINIRGVIDRHPVQPTLELRCLPVALDVDAVLDAVDAGVALVARLAGDAKPQQPA